ncbi:uncharacterized protein LACBIDRAFT_333747 [Laccaria bicolor S238N-H82]|uniref:Predicted protein n=1 Tax=Laccaria bicolor (strain S238N-H82 / ATCC MYA-4686) TaxID=486041 RepID=B0DWY1_LACBS|nr:uncharacterized protein LACBIDRAFT_333747 [Laccaria bicolor S238N-H82]EDR00839.1 predicted protein [Laccaria bicolor S238N-H82]|eukprot:XP_001888433.1 predicted protein [Laccaria bicolor S238N-H82]
MSMKESGRRIHDERQLTVWRGNLNFEKKELMNAWQIVSLCMGVEPSFPAKIDEANCIRKKSAALVISLSKKRSQEKSYEVRAFPWHQMGANGLPPLSTNGLLPLSMDGLPLANGLLFRQMASRQMASPSLDGWPSPSLDGRPLGEWPSPSLDGRPLCEWSPPSLDGRFPLSASGLLPLLMDSLLPLSTDDLLPPLANSFLPPSMNGSHTSLDERPPPSLNLKNSLPLLSVNGPPLYFLTQVELKQSMTII